MLKAVLFDMDGVIINTEPEYIKQGIKIGKTIGIELTEQELSKYAGIIPLDMWTELKKKYGFTQDPSELAEREAKLMDEHYETGALHPFAAALEFMKSCAGRGLKTAVATSSIKSSAQKVVRRLGISEYIGAISTSCMAGKSKPAPDIFLLAAKLLDVQAEECVVIEDAKSGVQAAKAAGMKAVGIAAPESKQDLSQADLVIGSLSEISMDMLYTL